MRKCIISAKPIISTKPQLIPLDINEISRKVIEDGGEELVKIIKYLAKT